jgi:hypothetical protein
LDTILTSIPWSNVSAGALVTLAVISIYRGWLWTKASVDALKDSYKLLLDDKDRQIEELRKTNHTVDARNDMLAEQVRQLVEIGHTTSAVLTALPSAAERR